MFAKASVGTEAQQYVSNRRLIIRWILIIIILIKIHWKCAVLTLVGFGRSRGNFLVGVDGGLRRQAVKLLAAY